MRNSKAETILADHGRSESVDVIRSLLSLGEKNVIDAGCGGLGFTRKLVGLGARVLGVDPDPIQSELNRQLLSEQPVPGLEFVESSAEQLPADDGSVDGVFFVFSLHHIPESIYESVFNEVLRVLSSDGFVMVIEPKSCPLFDIMRLFHDEDEELAAAQRVLREEVVPLFETSQLVTYHGVRKYESFEQFADASTSKSFNPHYTPADVRREEVREAFEKHAPDYRFQMPKHAMLLRGKKA